MKKLILILLLPVYMIVCAMLVCLYLHTSLGVMDKIAGICTTDMQLYALGTVWFGLSIMVFAFVFIGMSKIFVKILNNNSKTSNVNNSGIIVSMYEDRDKELIQTSQTLNYIMSNMSNTE